MIKERNYKLNLDTDRKRIIVDNFFSLLQKKNLSNKEYALKANIDPSKLSKMKDYKSFSLEDLITATKILDVSIEDLYYLEEERLRTKNNVIIDDGLINSKQSINIKLYKNLFHKPFTIIKSLLGFNIIIAFFFLLLTILKLPVMN